MSYCCLVLGAVWFIDAAAPPSANLQARVLHTFNTRGGNLDCLNFSFSADGRRFLLAGDKEPRLCDTRSGKEITRFSLLKPAWAERPYAALFPDGRTAAVAYGDLDLLTVDLVSGKILRRLVNEHLGSWQALSPNGKLLVSNAAERSSMGRALLLWDVESGKLLRQLRLRDPVTGKEVDPKRPWSDPIISRNECCGVVFTPNGKTVAVGVSDGSTRLCDVGTGAEIRRLFQKQDGSYWIARLAFSPDGRFLAVGSWRHDIMARVWDVTTGQSVRVFHLLNPPLPKDFRIIDPNLPGVYVNIFTGERLFRPYPPTGTFAVAFSPDGRTLATTTDGKIYLWELASGHLRCRLSIPGNHHFDRLVFSPSGLLAAGGRSIGRLWDWRAPWPQASGPLSGEALDRLWADLGSLDAVTGHRAIVALAAVPEQAVQFLKQRLRPVEPVTAKEFDRLIAELDDKKYAVRERAAERLVVFAERAKLALQRALRAKPSLEMKRRIELLLPRLEGPPRPERLRLLRGQEVLELLGTAQARRVLEDLAGGLPGVAETEDARAALRRLKGRD
jgi:WD40 repeat protein